MAEQDKGKAGDGHRRRADASDQPSPAVQVGSGPEGEQAADALATQAHGDVPPSGATAEDTAAKAGLAAGDDRADAQTSAAEGVAAAEAGNLQVQERVDAENVAGFRGLNVDPTPNLAYTSEGVAAGMPTPETDADAWETANRALRAGGGRFPVTDTGKRQAELTAEHTQQVAEATRARADEARKAAK
jgi:hypothetical protein